MFVFPLCLVRSEIMSPALVDGSWQGVLSPLNSQSRGCLGAGEGLLRPVLVTLLLWHACDLFVAAKARQKLCPQHWLSNFVLGTQLCALADHSRST